MYTDARIAISFEERGEHVDQGVKLLHLVSKREYVAAAWRAGGTREQVELNLSLVAAVFDQRADDHIRHTLEQVPVSARIPADRLHELAEDHGARPGVVFEQ